MSEAINYSHAYTDTQLSVGHSLSNIKGFSDNRLIKQSKTNRDSILALQDSMQDMPDTREDSILTHHFAPHVYARELFMPAGQTVIGKIHKHAHLNIIAKGKVVVATEEGNQEYNAPCVFTSYAGTKRAVQIIEDTTWITIHPTDETDLDKIEQDIIAPCFKDLLEGDL